jgi:hypothetical protein
MVVMMMLEQNLQSGRQNSLSFENSLCLQVVNKFGEEVDQFSLAVKTLTTTGVILNIQQLENNCKTEICKGRDVLFKVYSADIGGMVELPGKILWTRNNEDDTALTLGLELLDPLPPSIRNILEGNMSTGAKDMKLLWDYWDETKKTMNSSDLSEPVDSVLVISKACAVSEKPEIRISRNGFWIYWLGFGTILSGLAMQLPQSEYISFSGLVIMFGGSLTLAWKSVISLWEKPVD